MPVALGAVGELPLDAPLLMTIGAGGNACWHGRTVWMGALQGAQ